MGQVFIHTDRAGTCSASDYRDSGKLQQALYGSVLAVFSMEHRKGRIQADGGYSGGGDHQQTMQAAVRRDDSRDGAACVLVPGIVQQSFHRAGIQQPSALPGDPQQHRFIFFRVQVGEHRVSGLKRNGVFAGAAAEQNGQLSSGHNHTSLFCLSKA